jgi:hypothetical protein
MFVRSCFVASALAVFVGATVVAEQPGDDADLFPFVISYDAPNNVANASHLLDAPAGKHGFVRGQDGHFVTDAGRIRFWATNLCFDACFPSHDEAEELAVRMARLGINCVRMHHMDARSIWGDSSNKTIIDPKQLDRLDYLIYQLKQCGIYTNINLHVSRWLGQKEGFTSPDTDGRPKYDKGLGNFEPRMIELQKKYARDLLTHVNPYAKAAYAGEPAIAMVEISNEDVLFTEWSRGNIDDLPEPYITTFRKQWNDWLLKKYGSTDRLAKIWNVGQRSLGQQMLENGDFTKPLDEHWHLERDEQTECGVSTESDGPDGGKFLRLNVFENGKVSWRPQLKQGGFAIKKGEPYTLTFMARTDKVGVLGVNCMMSHEPWQRLGLSADAKLETKWQPHRFTFIATEDDDDVRITFSGFKRGLYELASVSLRPGGIVGVQSGQQLEDATVPVIRKSLMNRTNAAKRDWIDFLWDTEAKYWWGMNRYLKDELKVRSVVSGTQLSYSPPRIQARLDYIDSHNYWHHPSFPNRPWDRNDWFLRNRALVNFPGEGTLSGLAARRVAGLPFTVSEYNHPAPNTYAAEGFPMLASFGAFQDWDGLFTFTYSHNTDFEPQRLHSFFDIKGDPGKLAHHPVCAAMFLRGDVAATKVWQIANVTKEIEKEKLYETLSPWDVSTVQLGIERTAALRHGVALDVGLPNGLPRRTDKGGAEDSSYKSDTGQLHWKLPWQNGGLFTVDTPRSKLFTGFPPPTPKRNVNLGDVSLQLGETKLGWATVSMTCIDGDGFDKPGRILIAATGLVKNRNMRLEELGDDRVTVRDQWGDAPVLCEGVPATVRLPAPSGRVKLYPLDESGDRRTSVAAAADADGNAVIRLAPDYKTIWYEVEVME